MLSTVLSSLKKFGSADLFRIILAATEEAEKRVTDSFANNVVAKENVMDPLPEQGKDLCRVSRGKNCFSSGKAYQHHIYETLSSMTNKVIEVDGAKSGPDIVLYVKDQCIGLEVKNKGGFEGGSAKMTYQQDRLRFTEDTIHHQLLGDQVVYEGRNLPYYEGKINTTDYDEVKHIFDKEISKEVSDDTMAAYYKKTGVHYIQIEGYGLYHTGHDILQLQVPFFTCEQRLRIRTSKHKKNGVPTDVVGDINYNKKTLSKSPFDIEHTLPNEMNGMKTKSL
jgi:hypothetical protein